MVLFICVPYYSTKIIGWKNKALATIPARGYLWNPIKYLLKASLELTHHRVYSIITLSQNDQKLVPPSLFTLVRFDTCSPSLERSKSYINPLSPALKNKYGLGFFWKFNPHCCFSLNHSETVKAVTLVFCSI